MKRVFLTRVHVLEVVLQPLGPTTRLDFNVAADEVLVDQVAMSRRNRERVPLVEEAQGGAFDRRAPTSTNAAETATS